jgi:hypothetical protein
MGRLSACQLPASVLVLVAGLLALCASQSLAIASSSAFVGDTSTNYTFVLANVSAVTAVTFNFNSWSALTQAPYSSSTKCYLSGAALTCTSFPSNQIQCALSLTGNGLSANLTLTSMTNPSSTKPYPVTLTLTNSSASLNLTSSLTVSSLLNFPLSFQSYSKVLGATSSSISIDIVMNNYIDSTTVLSLSYNPALITITFPNTTSYNVLQNSNGTVLISNWNNLLSLGGKVTLSSVAITNPPAAIVYTVTGSFYFKQSNLTYNIQTVSTTVTLTTLAFSTLTVASPLSYGVLSALTIASACSFTQVSSANASNPAYTTVDFPAELQPTNASTCVVTSSSSCQHTKSGNYSLSNFQMGIGNFTTTSLTFTSYTYYAGAYYALCKGTASISLSLQATAPYILTSECDSATTSLNNAINLYTNVQSVAAGDTLYINGLKGVITNSNVWSQTTINGSTWYTYTLNSSNIAVNGSTKLVTVPLAYNNPNETVTNSITQLAIYRSNS